MRDRSNVKFEIFIEAQLVQNYAEKLITEFNYLITVFSFLNLLLKCCIKKTFFI